MNIDFDVDTSDPLEVIGVLAGVVLVLVGLGTLLGTPWTHRSGGILVAIVNILGILAAIGLGVGLTWLVTQH